MSCEHCAGYSVAHCPCCEEPKEDVLSAYEEGGLAAMEGDIYVPNPYEDKLDRDEWARGFYEYTLGTFEETAADIIDHLRELKGLNP